MVHTLIRKLTVLLKDEIDLDERIKEIYAKTGLSYDKIAEIVRTLFTIFLLVTNYVKNYYMKNTCRRFIKRPSSL